MKKQRLLFIVVVSIVVGLFSFFFTQNLEKITLSDAVRATAPGQFMMLTDGQVHYLLEGPEDGVPVVLIHGVTVPSFIWDETAYELAENGFRVLRPDLYGRGFSDSPRLKYTRELFSKQVEELADKVFAGQTYGVVGLSLGGAIAADLAANQPVKVDRLVLIAPFTIGFNVTPMQVPLLADYLATGMMIPKLEPGLQNLFADGAKMPTDWRERYEFQLTLKGFRRSFISTLVNFSSQDQLDLYGDIGEVDLPVLLLWGTEDNMTPYELYPVVKKLIPQAEAHAFEGAGHAVHIEKAAELSPLLIEFLRRDLKREQSSQIAGEPLGDADEAYKIEE